MGHSVPGIIGTRETTAGFIRSWQRHTGATSALRLEDGFPEWAAERLPVERAGS